jgi:hypothetical protein
VSATIHELPKARRAADADQTIAKALEPLARQELLERLGAVALQCEAQSRWFDRPEPDILEARLCLEALRDDVSRVRELVSTLID